MRRAKYNVSPKSERTCNGVVYDSKAECAFAQWVKIDPTFRTLHVEHAPGPLILSPGVKYEPDFLVCPTGEERPFYVDVKGVETPVFRTKMRLYISRPNGWPIRTYKAIYRGRRITGFRLDQVWQPGEPAPVRARKKRSKR